MNQETAIPKYVTSLEGNNVASFTKNIVSIVLSQLSSHEMSISNSICSHLEISKSFSFTQVVMITF